MNTNGYIAIGILLVVGVLGMLFLVYAFMRGMWEEFFK